MADEEIEKLSQKYQERLRKDFGETSGNVLRRSSPNASRDYQRFKKEYQPKPHSLYESACQSCANILTIKPNEKKAKEYDESIRIAHLDVTPGSIMSLSVFAFAACLLLGLAVSLLLGSMFFLFVAVILAVSALLVVQKYPGFIANSWRMKASNQMVLCVFYIVTYMRHTSNLENAIEFAAEHLQAPLSLDLKKVLWDTETEKYESLKESLDLYLETWRKWNLEFIEAMHLIEASLFEPTDSRRVTLLEKSLEVILDETYEKMLHYAHNLKSPITMLHMLGVILPILGLVILPLMVNFMGGVKWYHVGVVYNVFLPLIVFYLGKSVLSTRPTGYGDVDVSEQSNMKKYKNVILRLGPLELLINPALISMLVIGVLLFIGLAPLALHAMLPDDTAIGGLLEYRESKENPGTTVGPFSLVAAVLSMGITAAAGIGIGLHSRLGSENLIKIRERAKELEAEFAGSLFQLGNRIGDGIPLEVAFAKVADVMRDTRSGAFFELVNNNITRLGMSVETAIFNPKNGAIVSFPSPIIESSMKVLLVSSKKGPLIASEALISVARYIKEIHKVNERLKDLLADVISSMKSQIAFLAPAIAGIVVGITSMVTTILGRLGVQIANLGDVTAGAEVAGIGELFGDGIPTYYFQIILGLYVVQIVYILTIMANGIENGSDALSERYLIGANLIRSTVLYGIISLIVMTIFNLVAMQIMRVTTAF